MYRAFWITSPKRITSTGIKYRNGSQYTRLIKKTHNNYYSLCVYIKFVIMFNLPLKKARPLAETCLKKLYISKNTSIYTPPGKGLGYQIRVGGDPLNTTNKADQTYLPLSPSFTFHQVLPFLTKFYHPIQLQVLPFTHSFPSQVIPFLTEFYHPIIFPTSKFYHPLIIFKP